MQVHAFLSQLILYQGFYNAELEWVGVPKVQVAGSMNPSGGIGRYPLVSRPGRPPAESAPRGRHSTAGNVEGRSHNPRHARYCLLLECVMF